MTSYNKEEDKMRKKLTLTSPIMTSSCSPTMTSQIYSSHLLKNCSSCGRDLGLLPPTFSLHQHLKNWNGKKERKKNILRVCTCKINIFRTDWDLPCVNFINIWHTKNSYKICFGSFFYIHVTRDKLPKQRSYKKRGRKTLMKLTACRQLEAAILKLVI